MDECICNPPAMNLSCPIHAWIHEELQRMAQTPSPTDIVQEYFREELRQKKADRLEKMLHPPFKINRKARRKGKRK